ncbi:MAG: hypothetical protein H7Z42_04920 [Roseiflexaceae bacterium]|nr:hypothetical protein [Roseiflexaceae bacterium]
MIPRISLLLLSITLLALGLPLRPSAAPQAYAASPPVALLDAAPWGINTHLATRYTDLDSMAVPAELVAQSGAGWAREDVHWWRVQPREGVWDWSFTDAAFRALIERGVKIVGVLGHPPGWATPFGGDAPQDVSFYAPDQQRFVEYTRAVVTRYGGYVDHWEVWNEPDNQLFWRPTPDPAAYARLLIETHAAIKQIDPQASVLLGGISPFDTRFLRGVAEAGAWQSFDILAIHPYVDPHSPEDGALLAAADGVRAMMERLGQKPLWATEVGWSSGPGDRDRVGVDEDTQANYLTRAMLLMWRAGIERSFWYALKDDPGNPYGLLALGSGRNDYSRPKPAYRAFQTLSRQLAGAEFVSMNDLFTREEVLSFEPFGRWTRGDQRNGTLNSSLAASHSQLSAALHYNFPTLQNDYVVFTRQQPAPIPGTPHKLGLWVYGDGSANTLKIWLRDAEGELLQYSFGAVGTKGWHQLYATLGGELVAWDRISQGGNGKLDFPASVAAFVLDDGSDSFVGRGTVYFDTLSAVGGPEGYDLRARRGNTIIDVLWSPDQIAARLPIAAAQATSSDHHGNTSTFSAVEGVLPPISLSETPRFITHETP